MQPHLPHHILKENSIMNDKIVTLTEDNKQDFIQALNLSLVSQSTFHKDFLITDIISVDGTLQIVTSSCNEVQKSDRYDLILKVFNDCQITVGFDLV